MLDAPDLQESRDLLLVPSNCGDGVPSGIRPVSIGRACDSQPRVRSGCSVGEASLKQANILGSTDSRHTVFPDRMKPQRARSMRFLAPGARPSCLSGYYISRFYHSSIPRRAKAIVSSCSYMNLILKALTRTRVGVPRGSGPTVVSDFATVKIAESSCIHLLHLVRENRSAQQRYSGVTCLSSKFCVSGRRWTSSQ